MVRISGQMQFYYVKRFENTERIRNLSQIITIYETKNFSEMDIEELQAVEICE